LKKTNQDKPKRIHKKKLQVSGYWGHNQYGVSYFVKPYKRTKVTAKRRQILAAARHIEAEAKPLILGWQESERGPEWKKYRAIENDERTTYTYKIQILVHADYKYRMFFTLDKNGEEKLADVPLGVSKDAPIMQYWHSKFEPTIKKATVDFLEKVPEIKAYGVVQWLAIDLYRVSGVGPLKKKNWKLLKSFDEPEDVK
jgi:hypothetical protein